MLHFITILKYIIVFQDLILLLNLTVAFFPLIPVLFSQAPLIFEFYYTLNIHKEFQEFTIICLFSISLHNWNILNNKYHKLYVNDLIPIIIDFTSPAIITTRICTNSTVMPSKTSCPRSKTNSTVRLLSKISFIAKS